MNDTITDMINRANKVRKNAYVPYSNFLVSCCLRTEDDEFFVGCNVENASYSLTICAETAAIAAMIASGSKAKIREVVIVAESIPECPPCGACRQRLYEFSRPDTKVYLCTKDGKISRETTMAELLPFAFDM